MTQIPGPSLVTKFIETGLKGRPAHWANAWAMFLAAPLLGHGPHTYGLFHTPPWPHSLYFEVLAEQGLLGLATLGGMLACAVVGGWKLRRDPSEDARLLGAGALAGLVGLCGAGLVELTLVREPRRDHPLHAPRRHWAPLSFGRRAEHGRHST